MPVTFKKGNAVSALINGVTWLILTKEGDKCVE